MKRFLVFAFDQFYPRGGWTDFRSAHDTLDDAKNAAQALDESPPDGALGDRWDYIDIVDVERLETVWSHGE